MCVCVMVLTIDPVTPEVLCLTLQLVDTDVGLPACLRAVMKY